MSKSKKNTLVRQRTVLFWIGLVLVLVGLFTWACNHVIFHVTKDSADIPFEAGFVIVGLFFILPSQVKEFFGIKFRTTIANTLNQISSLWEKFG